MGSDGERKTVSVSHSVSKQRDPLVLLADHLADAGLPLALLVPRDAPVLAARLLEALALPAQRLHHLLLCDLRISLCDSQCGHQGPCTEVTRRSGMQGPS